MSCSTRVSEEWAEGLKPRELEKEMKRPRDIKRSIILKKATIGPAKSRPTVPTKSWGKCGQTNLTIAKCRVSTNKYMWCGTLDHSIATCLRRQKAKEKEVTRPLAPPHWGTLPPKPVIIGWAYVMSKKEDDMESNKMIKLNIECRNLKVTFKDRKGREACFYGERNRKEYPIISIMKVSKLSR